MRLSQTMCNQEEERQWKQDSIGYDAVTHKANSGIIGNLAQWIWEIIGRSIIQAPITKNYGPRC